MAGRIPVGSLITDIKLNGDQPVKTLRQLRQAVSSTTSAWKAQEAVLKSAGKQTEAAKAKYAGLTETVKNQRKYIEALADKQRNLKKVQAEADQTTEKGKQAYKNATEEIQKNAAQTLRATTRLESLTKQQEKAKSSLNYYKSGLAEAQKSLKQTQAVTKSYVERLKAEGKGYESAKAKLNGYKSSLENLNKQQKIQAQELARIASESGKSSDAYKRQEIRLNQTATTLAKTKSAMNELNSSMHKANPTVFDKLKTKLTGLDSQAEKTHRTFKEVFMGSALGNALSNSLSNIGSSLKNAYEEGMNLNLAVAKINGRFKGMGMSTRQIQSLDKQLGELKANTAMTGDNVANLQAHMLNWSTIGTKGAMQMAKTIAGVGDTSKLTGDQIERVSASLQRVGSTGKVTYSSLSRITKAAPTFMQALAKGAGMSQSKMIALLKTGKVTQKQFQQWMASASKYSDDAFKGFGKTQAGALKSMQVARQKLEQQFTKPIFNAKTSGLQALKNIMTSKAVMNGAQQLGKAISNVIGYLDKNKGDIVAITKNVVSLGVEVGKAVWKDFAAIIQNIGKGNGKDSSSALHTLATATADLAKNKTAVKTISDAIIAMVAIKGIGKVSGGLFSIGKGAVTAYKSVKALRSGFKGIELAEKATKGEKAWAKFGGVLSKTFSRFRKVGSKTWTTVEKAGIKAWTGIEKGWVKASDLGTKAGKAIAKGFRATGNVLAKAGKWSWSKIKSGFNFAKKFGQEVGKKISAGIKASTKFSMGKRLATGALAGAAVATPEVINAVKDRHSADKRSQDIGGAVGAVAGGALTSMIPVVGPMLAPVGAIIGKYAGQWGGKAVNSFTKGWQRNKPPKKFWSLENLGWSTHDTFRKVGKWGADVGKKFGQGLRKGKSFAKKNSKELALTAVSPLLGIPALLYKNNPKFRKWANGVGKNIKSGLSKVGKAVNHFKSSLSKNFKKAWDNVYKHSSKGTKQIMRSVSRFAKSYIKTNSKANKETIKNFASFSKRLKKNHGDLFKTVGQTAKKQLAIEKRRWSANWKNISRTAKGIWNGIHKNASDLYRKLNSATHGGLGKVFSGFKSFGNSLKNFWSSLLKGIQSTFSHAIDNIKGAANNVNKFFHGKLKVGSLHLASGTDWKKKYGYPAILNDGHDSPATNNKEGILNPDGSVEVQQGVNVPRWIFPWQDVINARDMAKLFGRSVHLANGTVDLYSLETKNPVKILTTLTKLTKKKYDEDRLRHQKQKERHDKNDSATANERKRLIKHEQYDKADRAKVAKEIRDALKRGRNTKGLIAQLNKLTSRISQERKAVAKTNPHHGETLVDEGLLLGANSRIGKSKWISDALFKKLTTAPKTKKTKKRKTKKRKSTRRRSTSISRRSYSSGSSRVSVPSISASGASLKGLSSKSISVTAKVKGSKQIKALEKAMKRIKGGTHKVTVKTKGVKSVKSLSKAIKKIKGKKSTVSVKTKGTSQLKSLHKNINTVEKRLNVLARTAKKDKFGEQISRQAEKAVKSLEGKGNFTKKISSMSKATVKDFKSMTSSVGKTTDKIRKSTEQDFSNLYKRSYQSVKRLHDGVIKLGTATARGFGGAMHKMVGYASDSMRGTIRQINRGIRGIDAVLKQFGGNSSVINPVHFAKGTDANGRLTHDTLAVVNDAQSGPRQEAVVTDQNDIIIPHGNNRRMLLRKGWGVLNGTQTQSLSLPHFANGTGISKKELRKLAENSLKHFADSFKSMFTNNLHDVGSDLTKDSTDLSKRSGTHFGNPWSQAMWTVINKAIGSGGGSRAKFLQYAKDTFDGVKYQMGAASKTLSDCSGMVMQALRHFGINIGRTTVAMQESSGVQYLGKNLSKTEPGDLVIFGHGTGAAGHVGIINNPAKGTMFNETPPYARISKISDAMSMGYGYYRVKGLHDQSKHQPKIKPSLLALAKRELGGKALNWIGDHLSENEDGIGGKPTGDHLHWLKQAGIPESWWHYMELIIDGGNGIPGESHWNPRITNPSSGAYGIPQSLPASKMASAGRDWRTNAITQLRWMKDYIRGRYGTAKAAWEHKVNTSTHWYANGGIASSPSIFGEAGPEMAVPLIPSKSTRAWELIGKAVGILTANSNLNANQQRISNKDEKDEHDLLKAMLLVLQKMSAQNRDIHITLETPEGRKLWELVEPFYKQDRRQDMIKERRGLSARFR
ncbi:tape measure protein [Lactobacillus crispatus]|uniref:aggregation-promoting factor C-terminal-like domain-containing protein n=1 Tax=Lactobacillus crispatus TaxID=47770 RepID=UPI0022AC0448|nr:tape measure protein [Lactobacillus crispatus]MCZ3845796.1 tape measure protein [Lactobacillus crispatus]MCZ3848040.1 tape measure protein [Lactobacillus crispatus]MCZ3853977.1 tape measure protein [Lactobacillus crispatus]MCZ3856278.1 tape measure protein [Lactobacillus crispatus]MCZ3858517.1 tape measure protein [Lactobacillus crispatus]